MKERGAYEERKELISTKNDVVICPQGTGLLPPEFHV